MAPSERSKGEKKAEAERTTEWILSGVLLRVLGPARPHSRLRRGWKSKSVLLENGKYFSAYTEPTDIKGEWGRMGSEREGWSRVLVESCSTLRLPRAHLPENRSARSGVKGGDKGKKREMAWDGGGEEQMEVLWRPRFSTLELKSNDRSPRVRERASERMARVTSASHFLFPHSLFVCGMHFPFPSPMHPLSHAPHLRQYRERAAQ